MKAKPTQVAVLLGVLLLAAQGAAFAARFTDRLEKTFTVTEDVVLSLSNTNGSVSVEVWDRDEVEIVAEKRVDSRSASDAEEVFEELEIIIDSSDGRIEVETRHPSAVSGLFDWLLGRARNASVRYEIRVPRTAELDLRTVNGHVRTEGAEGRQRLRSTNGRIEVDDAQEGVDARTTNGSITVEVAAAPSRIDIELGSTNGGITLYLPADLAARLEARTVNGSVKTDLPVTVEGRTSRRRISGALNGGGPGRVQLSTTNGSVRINRSTR